LNEELEQQKSERELNDDLADIGKEADDIERRMQQLLSQMEIQPK
jgi:hypothetical protein